MYEITLTFSRMFIDRMYNDLLRSGTKQEERITIVGFVQQSWNYNGRPFSALLRPHDKTPFAITNEETNVTFIREPKPGEDWI